MTTANKKEKKVLFSKDQLGLFLGVIAILIIVGFLFFIDDNFELSNTGQAIAEHSAYDTEKQDITVSCNAEALAEVNSLAVKEGCQVI